MRTFVLMLSLLALAGPAALADDDPEPPGGGSTNLRALRGTWKMSRMLSDKVKSEPANTSLTYTFEGDRFTIDSGKSRPRSYTVKVVARYPFTLECTPEKGGGKPGLLLKIEKDELFVVTARRAKGIDQQKDIFAGEVAPVAVFKRQKK
jgi:uncharacterized protein (TIGR03067 family)